MEKTMADEVAANNYRYYATVTDVNGPAMTWQIFAVGWMELRNLTAARVRP